MRICFDNFITIQHFPRYLPITAQLYKLIIFYIITIVQEKINKFLDVF